MEKIQRPKKEVFVEKSDTQKSILVKDNKDRISDVKNELKNAYQGECLNQSREAKEQALKNGLNLFAEEMIETEEVDSFIRKIEMKIAEIEDVEVREVTEKALNFFREINKMIEKEMSGSMEDGQLSGPKIFKSLFGFYPVGNIKVSRGLAWFRFECEKEDDFKVIVCGHDNCDIPYDEPGAQSKVKGIPVVTHRTGLALKAFDLIAKSTGLFSDRFAHEDQHAMNQFFQDTTDRILAGDNNKKNDIIFRKEDFNKKYKDVLEKPTANETERAEKRMDLVNLLVADMRESRVSAEEKAKDEILAYFADGTLSQGFLRKLANNPGGTYDFVTSLAEHYKKQYSKHIGMTTADRIIKQVFSDEYKKVIREAIDSITYLGNLFSKKKAIALLVNEPLGEWKEVADRAKVNT